MLMLTKTHAAVVAAKDAEIAGLMKRLEATKESRRDIWRTYCGADREVRELRVKLAVFTAPRARDAKGHFLPTKKPIDQIIEALEAL